MSKPLLSLDVRLEHDVVLARQRARQISGLLGFDTQDQTRIATAVSEIARNAVQYAGGGRVEFAIEDGSPPLFLVRVSDRGPGIKDLQAVLDGRFMSPTGIGLGIVGVRRLMDRFQIDSAPETGTAVVLGRAFPRRLRASSRDVARVAEELARRPVQDPLDEVRQQNHELLRTLEELQKRQAELSELNRELEDTNRGVVALYAELEEKADALRRASEMKSRFLSNMSHEFRTPLNSILALSGLLLDRIDGELTGEQEKQLTYVRKAAEGLMELINDLLDLAKVEAGKLTVRPSEFEVTGLFGGLRGLLRPLLGSTAAAGLPARGRPGAEGPAAAPAVALVFDEPHGLPPLCTDESKVSQVLRNFISNALKFTDRGEVRVSAAAGPADTVLFAVADTGIGIAPEDHEAVFQEFTQIDSAHQKKVKGTGLGLPLSRRLAELLGGRITLTSAPGQGATFTLALPRVYRGPAEESVAADAPRVDPTRLPVLVVEDNRETLYVYEKYLAGSGFQVLPARSLKVARRLLAEARPAAVIIDILLEGESSWELLAELKREPATRSLPVIVVTMVDNEDKARELGADAFTIKPVERDWLLERLAAAPQARARDKILVVDDDEVSRYLLRGLLADSRFAVVEAAGGVEGLRLARQERPRAVFLDLDMPDLSGVEVLRGLRDDDATRNVPVIVRTARVLEAEEQARLALEVSAVLSKQSPSREAALTAVRAALERALGGEHG